MRLYGDAGSFQAGSRHSERRISAPTASLPLPPPRGRNLFSHSCQHTLGERNAPKSTHDFVACRHAKLIHCSGQNFSSTIRQGVLCNYGKTADSVPPPEGDTSVGHFGTDVRVVPLSLRYLWLLLSVACCCVQIWRDWAPAVREGGSGAPPPTGPAAQGRL